MKEEYASREEVAAHKWLIEQILTHQFRQLDDPSAAMRGYATYATNYWSEVSQIAADQGKEKSSNFAESIAFHVGEILNDLADGLEKEAAS